MRMRIAVDLLWVKPKSMGGVESYVRNLLDGFRLLDENYEMILLTSIVNYESFKYYAEDSRFSIKKMPVDSFKLLKTVIWENLKLSKYVEGLSVDFCFVPYYRCPVIKSKIRYVCVLHDLQALHYPEYFSKPKFLWLKYYWKYSLKNAYKVVAISNFVKSDIIDKYGLPDEKIVVIYNPITTDMKFVDFNVVADKYKIKENNYYYTISSLLLHKNLITIIMVINRLVKKGNDSTKLLISGIKGNGENMITEYIIKNGLEKNIIITGFIPNEERNTLLKYAKCFLFPSIFEGFGMPPIEAMRLNTKTVTTKCTALPEVTDNKAIYINDPYSVDEWLEVIENIDRYNIAFGAFSQYDPENVAQQYYNYFKKIL